MTIAAGKWTIWGQPSCVYCERAWDLIESKDGRFIEYNVVGETHTKDQFLAANPGKRSVPQIYCNGEYVGNYDDLVRYFNDSI